MIVSIAFLCWYWPLGSSSPAFLAWESALTPQIDFRNCSWRDAPFLPALWHVDSRQLKAQRWPISCCSPPSRSDFHFPVAALMYGALNLLSRAAVYPLPAVQRPYLLPTPSRCWVYLKSGAPKAGKGEDRWREPLQRRDRSGGFITIFQFTVGAVVI